MEGDESAAEEVGVGIGGAVLEDRGRDDVEEEAVRGGEERGRGIGVGGDGGGDAEGISELGQSVGVQPAGHGSLREK